MNIDERLKKSAVNFVALSPEARDALLKQQRASYVKTEIPWPKAKFHWENGVKIYESLEDYCND